MSDVAVNFIDNPHAPDIFAHGVTGFSVNNGVVTITFESARVNHETTPGPVNRVVIGRLVLPISIAQGLALGLFDFLKSQGFDPTDLISAGQPAN